MISNSEIIEAVQKAQPVFEKIQRLYRQMPETTCDCKEPGTCCAFLPEMTLMEALQWFQVMQQMPDAERVALIGKFVEFYLTNPIRRTGCPFLSKGTAGFTSFVPSPAVPTVCGAKQWGKRAQIRVAKKKRDL